MIRRRLLGVAVFVAALVLWELWARREASFLLPPISTVAERAVEVWPTDAFLSDVAASLRRLAVGYVLGALLAVAAGVVLGASVRARRTFEPLLEFLRAIPPIAVVPVAIVVLGVGDATAIAVIAFGVFFPVLVNTVEGVRAVAPEARDTAAMLQVGRFGAALPRRSPRRAPVDRGRAPHRAVDRPRPRRDLRVHGGLRRRSRAVHLDAADSVQRAGGVRRHPLPGPARVPPEPGLPRGRAASPPLALRGGR